MGLVYLDSSAIVKLVVEEPETPALRSSLAATTGRISCDLARTEVVRAVRRLHPDALSSARAVLDRLILQACTARLFEAAALLEPPTLRSLDALHLAAALDLADDLDTLVTYDTRMAEAAEAMGLVVESPGLSR